MKRHIAIVDYGAGNLHSAHFGVARVADVEDFITITDKPEALDKATHIVLPGVGAFGDCITALKAKDGIIESMHRNVVEQGKPFLGICVGMQMLMETGYEHGTYAGLGWIEGDVVAIAPKDPVLQTPLKIPHMGWNDLTLYHHHPVMAGLSDGDHAYFVHSYHVQCDAKYVLATTDYGQTITAVIAKDNIIGTQFHPEKSQQLGIRILDNFVHMR